MMKRVQTLVLAVMLGLGVVTTSGCFWLVAGAAAGAAGYAWIQGAVVKDFDVSTTELYDATIRALRKLELPILNDTHDRLSAKVESQFADGNNVEISINALTEQSAKIKIRVGFLGNKTKSVLIYNTIQDYLY